MLEEHSLPGVSVQMLYRTGTRDEEYGRTGFAHYLEHMAFRATENFPVTQVTTRISGVGGEWHGYTWQTTYFETLPKPQRCQPAACRDSRPANAGLFLAHELSRTTVSSS